MSVSRLVGIAALCSVALLSVASAASGQTARVQRLPRGGPPAEGQPGSLPKLTPDQRAAMEQRLQSRINEVLRQRLALSDEQFGKLRDMAVRVEDDRRSLRNEELTTRFALRQELLAGDRVNEARVAELLDRLPKLERRRVDLLEQEQRDLSKFLSASQRARYFALQDELRRSMQDMQRRRIGIDGGPDSAPPPVRRLQRRGVPPLR